MILDQSLKDLPTSVWQKIARIDELKGQWIGGVKLGHQVLGRLKKSVLLTSRGASTRIEGSMLSDEDVEKLLSTRPTINQVLDKLLVLKKIERLGLGRGTRSKSLR